MGISVPKLRKYTNPRVVSLMLKMLSIFFVIFSILRTNSIELLNYEPS